MNETPADLYQRLRIETCALLGFDLSNLSAAQGARLDRATMLRWELDRMAGSQVRGDAIDVSRAVAASEALEKLLSPSFNGEVAAPQVREDHSARDKVIALIEGYAVAAEFDRDETVAALEAEIALLRTEIDGKNAAIAALTGTIAPPAASPAPPTPTPEQTTSPPEQTSPQPPLPPPNASPPAHYLRREDGFSTEGGRGVDRWSNRQ